MGVLYIPFAVLVLMGTVNGVNLTDGLDGLAAGISVMTELSYGVLFCLMAAAADLSTWGARAAGQEGMAAFCGAAAAAAWVFCFLTAIRPVFLWGIRAPLLWAAPWPWGR